MPEKPSTRITGKPLLSAFLPFLKYFILPFLAASYPTLYFYGNNVHELLLSNLRNTIFVYLLIAVLVYILSLAMYRWNPLKASIASLIFLVFFNLYGYLANLLLKLDWFPVYSFITLPLVLLLAFYVIWWANKLSKSTALGLWKIGTVFFTGLVIINLITIVPAEITKEQDTINHTLASSKSTLAAYQKNPDIYYIVLDEFSGFTPMREYWNNPEVDKFQNYLVSEGFVVFEDPHGNSIETPREIASRLNYQNYSFDLNSDTLPRFFNLIANNKVMRYLKGQGYTTVTFNEMKFPYPTADDIVADVTYDYNDIPATNISVYFDDFWILVADKTMLKEFSGYYKRLGSDRHTNMVFFTTKKVGELDSVPSPKFVYVHLMIPHAPFLFDEKGNQNSPDAFVDYRYYLGNYNFSIYLVQQMVEGILDNTGQGNPPVIILQSDHGLRNYSEEGGYFGQLQNYPDEYKTSILYAIHLPGYEPTYTAQEMDPINTFPLIFNYLFDAQIPLQ